MPAHFPCSQLQGPGVSQQRLDCLTPVPPTAPCSHLAQHPPWGLAKLLVCRLSYCLVNIRDIKPYLKCRKYGPGGTIVFRSEFSRAGSCSQAVIEGHREKTLSLNNW